MLRSAVRALGRAALFLLLTLIVAEGSLRAAALWVRDRAVEPRRPGAFRVLALGDSHTYGGGVSAEQSYPGQLGRLLDEREPGSFEVINNGHPGFNTSMVLERLPTDVARFEPDMVLLWVGINDTWNATDADRSERVASGASFADRWVWRLDALACRLRAYRLARVWLHDRKLERDVEAFRDRPGLSVDGRVGEPIPSGSVAYGGIVERITVEYERVAADEARRRAERNYAAMLRWLRGAAIPVALVEYPFRGASFDAVNEALRAAAGREGVPLVRSSDSVARLQPEQRQRLWAAHPNAMMYREIARDVVPLVLAERAGRGGVDASAPAPAGPDRGSAQRPPETSRIAPVQ